MNNIFQSLLGILTSPISYFVLFALIGGIGRFASWAKDQRAKREALMARREAEAEALRTGRSTGGPRTAQVSSTPQEQQAASRTAADRQARLRQMQEQRAAQLRELQQKRLAELRARRAAQLSGQAPPQQAAPQQPASQARAAAPFLAQQRATPRPRPVAQAPASRPSQTQRAASRPKPTQPKAGVEAVYARSRDSRLKTDAFAIDRHNLSIEDALASQKRAKSTAHAFDRPEQSRGRPARTAALFGSSDDLRRGILAAEILGKPLALRDDD